MHDHGGRGSGQRPPAPDSLWSDRPQHEGTNGHSHHPGPGRPYDTMAAEMIEDDAPIDLVELQADDELVGALASGLGVSGPGQQGYDANDRLVAMLAAWRADVDAEPMPELVEPDVAVEMLAPPPRSRRISYLRPVIAAVAVAACGLGVLSVTAHEAQPGDSLWGLSKVLYTERAEQVQAAADLRTGIDRVNAKLASGDTAGARQDLDAMGPLLAKVGSGGDQAYFDQQRQFLAAKVAETPPGTPTDPAAPLRNGTPAPRPPATEGSVDQGPGTVTSPQEPVVPAPGPGGEPGTTGTGPDPRTLQGPGTPPEAAPIAPTESPTTTSPDPTSPTTEGSADPTETTTTTRPTASAGGGEDTSSTTSGAVSSTPR